MNDNEGTTTVGDISGALSTAAPGATAPALQLPVRDTADGATPPAGTGSFSWNDDSAAPPAASSGTGLADRGHAAFTVLLHRYSGQDDIALARAGGTDGAPHDRPVAVRSHDTRELTLTALASVLGARYREAARTTVPGEPADFGGGLRAGTVYSDGTAPVLPEGFALLLDMSESADGAARFTLHYDRGLFTPDLIGRMAANLGTLLRHAEQHPQTPVADLPLLSEHEIRRLLQELNDTARPYDRDTALHALVEAQAARTPDAPAVEWRDRVLTYRQLDRQASRLSRALAAAGITPGSRIGLSLPRTDRLVVLLLAVHKAGCAYVPLDPAYPADRLTSIAATADMTAVVHDGDETPDWLSGVSVAALPWAELWEKASAEDDTPPGVTVGPEAATHLIYTSGSTGLPKGVMIGHRNVVALLAWSEATYAPEDLARVLFSTSLNFDLSVYELWAPLTRGGCVVVVDNVLALTEDEGLRPTLVNTVPSALNVLLQRATVPASVRVLNVAGEPLSKELVNAAFATTGVQRLYNLYGPSEDTTYSTWKCFTGPTAETPSIGVPMAGPFRTVPRASCTSAATAWPAATSTTPSAPRPRSRPLRRISGAYPADGCTAPETWHAGPRTANSASSAARTTRSRCAASVSNWARSNRWSARSWACATSRPWPCAPARTPGWSATWAETAPRSRPTR
jgi:hypothetical protein